MLHCSVPENSLTPPPKRDWNFLGGGVMCSVRQKKIKKCMKLNRNFKRGGGDLEKFPSTGEV